MSKVFFFVSSEFRGWLAYENPSDHESESDESEQEEDREEEVLRANIGWLQQRVVNGQGEIVLQGVQDADGSLRVFLRLQGNALFAAAKRVPGIDVKIVVAPV